MRRKKIHSKEENRNISLGYEQTNWLLSDEEYQKRSLGEFVLCAKNNHVESNIYAKGQSWTSGAVDLLLFPLVNQRRNCVIIYPHPLPCSTHQHQPRSNQSGKGHSPRILCNQPAWVEAIYTASVILHSTC